MIILVILILLTVVLAVVPGIGLIAIVPATIAVAYGIWLLTAFLSGRSPGQVVRRTHQEGHLGPGGPDDPDRSRP
jgi:hypothetical protein